MRSPKISSDAYGEFWYAIVSITFNSQYTIQQFIHYIYIGSIYSSDLLGFRHDVSIFLVQSIDIVVDFVDVWILLSFRLGFGLTRCPAKIREEMCDVTYRYSLLSLASRFSRQIKSSKVLIVIKGRDM